MISEITISPNNYNSYSSTIKPYKYKKKKRKKRKRKRLVMTNTNMMFYTKHQVLRKVQRVGKYILELILKYIRPSQGVIDGVCGKLADAFIQKVLI